MSKRDSVFGIAVVLALLASPAHGASLSYNPDQVTPTIEAGSVATLRYAVTLRDGGVTSYQLRLLDRLDGSLPLSWLQVNPATGFISAFRPMVVADVRILVPADAAPGVYTGTLRSSAMAAHGLADPGGGLRVTVTVPSHCNATPSFEIAGFGPALLWPPNHGMEEVTVSGHVRLPDGCALLGAGYVITDEYGVYTAAGALTVGADGAFTLALPVEAWRNGDDKDGRHYTIMLSAQDEAGGSDSGPLEVLVPHDLRSKK